MINKDLFGVTAQPVHIWNDPIGNTFVICKHDTEKLTYWNKDKHEWVDNIFNATLWPKDKEGENAYLANNVYSCTSGFTAREYQIVDLGAFNLSPCFIKHINTSLYLVSFHWKSGNKLVTYWSNDYDEALYIKGPEEALNIIWRFIYGPN